MATHGFKINVPESVLEDLRYRLDRVRWPKPTSMPTLVGDGEPAGLPQTWLRRFLQDWRTFDWRAQERKLNELPQQLVELDGLALHVVHMPGRGPDPTPLLLCHGWPSSFLEFTKVLGPLTDPAAHGGDPADAFSVVIPSLPGFGFSDPLPAGRAGDTVPLYAELMSALGYYRFGVHGGDIGSYIAHRLALDLPERIIGLHVTYPVEPPTVTEEDRDAEELRFLARRPADHERGGAYAHLQRTRPLTLAYALADSPLGLAAWVLDKWREWTDCDGNLDTRFDRDELLTLLTLYWVCGIAGSGLSYYRDWGLAAPPALLDPLYPHALPGVEPRPLTPATLVEVPAAVALFRVRYPREFIERGYRDLRRLTEMPRGGHFAAFEEAELVIDDLRAFYRPLGNTQPAKAPCR